MKRTAIYARVSTEEQSRHGLSIASQLEELRKYVKENDLFLVGEYVDAGISARKSYKKRPELLRLLGDVEKDKVDLILFIKLDRWFRNVQNYYEVQAILDAHGTAWRATLEDYETVTASGRFKVNIMLSVAQDEADRTSERIKFVFDGKRERGEPTWGKQVLGYKLVDKKPTIDEETADYVRAMFQHYIDCRSITELQRWFYEQYGFQRSCIGLKRLLSNKAYAGKNDIFDFPAIIDLDTFRRVQEILRDREERHHYGNEHKRTYLFVGFVYCAECGGRMKTMFSQSGHPYYTCNKHQRFGNTYCTNNKHIREEAIEQFLLDNVVEAIKDRNIAIEKQNAENSAVDKEKILRKMQKLKDLYMEDLISKEIYVSDYRALECELNSAQTESQIVPIDIVEEMIRMYGAATKEDKKAFWSRTVKRISITASKEISFIPN